MLATTASVVGHFSGMCLLGFGLSLSLLTRTGPTRVCTRFNYQRSSGREGERERARDFATQSESQIVVNLAWILSRHHLHAILCRVQGRQIGGERERSVDLEAGRGRSRGRLRQIEREVKADRGRSRQIEGDREAEVVRASLLF